MTYCSKFGSNSIDGETGSYIYIGLMLANNCKLKVDKKL